MYDALLFDNDGVLVGRTPADLLRGATYRAFDAVGVPDPDPDHVEALLFGVTPETVREVAAAHEVDPAALWAARDRAASEAQIRAARAGRKTPYDDVAALRALDPPLGMGVVSRNQQATVDFLLDHFGLGARFDAAYGREPTVESLTRAKPAPHHVRRALADLAAGAASDGEPGPDRGRFGDSAPDPDSNSAPPGRPDALLVGDDESDVVAAHRAGIDSAFIRRPHRRDADLDVEPTYVIDDLHDLRRVAR